MHSLNGKSTGKRRIALGAFILLMALFPLVFNHRYFIHLVAVILIYAVTAHGQNLITGYTGQLSFGHSGFLGLGAYGYSLSAINLGWGFLPSVLFGAVIAAIFGTILGIPSLRLKGPYLGLATAGFAEIIRTAINNWESLTNGPRGIMGIPPPSLFGYSFTTKTGQYYVMLAFFLGITLLFHFLISSKYGRAWIAIRNNESAANACGVNTFLYKVLAFTLSSFLGGLGGALYASFFGFISPESFTFARSVFFLSIVAVGGRGTLWCSLVGSAALMLLPEALTFLADFEMVFYGLLLVICMIFLPKGLIGLAEPIKGLFTGGKSAGPPDSEKGVA